MQKFFLILLVTVNFAKAEMYQLGDYSFELNVPSEWLAKGGAQKGSLVFFDTKSPPPRPIVSVYFSSFRYPSSSELSSEFTQRHIKEKNEWVKSSKGKVLVAPKLEYIGSEKSAISTLAFENEHGSFYELSRYEQCNQEQSLVLKILVPYAQWESDTDTYGKKYWQPLSKIKLCNKK